MSDSFETIERLEGVEELRLTANGLRVMLLPDESVPVVSVCVVYHVGSRNEAVGHTGSTHLLEHLLFKGTRKFNPEAGRPLARVLERVGAHFNATTWLDRTNYYETLPAEHLELALELEADRMRWALLRGSDLSSEMTVVRNEFERGENDPFDVLLKESFAMAFREHPYHHPTIGWRSDIENVTIERLRTFYDTFYHPGNATLVLVGSFERTGALELVAEHFGAIPPAGHAFPPVVTTEPPQQGERRFVVRRSGEVGWVCLSWRTPEAAHPDTHALAVLADVLSGGVTSRLYQGLVESGDCIDAQAVAWQLRDPGLFQVFATLSPGTSHDAVESKLRETVRCIVEEGVRPEEVERARVQVEAAVAYQRESPGQVAAALTEAISSADWRFYIEYPERIRAVREEDVRRVAATYLADDALTVGAFVPVNGGGGGSPVPDVHPRPLVPRPCCYTGLIGERVEEVGCGEARVWLLPRRQSPTVHLYASLLAGHGMVGVDRWSAASLVPDMLERGTTKRSRLELARAQEDRGVDLAFSPETFSPFEVTGGGRCLARHLPLFLELAVEMLRHPVFPQDELDKLRVLRLGELVQAQEDTFQRAFEAFSRLVYPAGHPFHRRTVDEKRGAIQALRVEDLQAVHSELYGTASLVMVLVGDLEPGEVRDRLGELLCGWGGGRATVPEIERREADAASPGVVREFMADKPNADVVLGHPGGLRRRDHDYFAAMLSNSVLGHSTLSARLGQRLRDREGLTYGVISRYFGASLLDGPWAVTFSVSPADLERGLACAREEMTAFCEEGPSEAEVDDERQAMAGALRVGLATPAGMARELGRLARHGLDPGEIDRLAGRILATPLEDVRSAGTRHLKPSHLSLAAAGELVDHSPSAL